MVTILQYTCILDLESSLEYTQMGMVVYPSISAPEQKDKPFKVCLRYSKTTTTTSLGYRKLSQRNKLILTAQICRGEFSVQSQAEKDKVGVLKLGLGHLFHSLAL